MSEVNADNKKSWLIFAYVTVIVTAILIGFLAMSDRYSMIVSNNPMYAYKLDKATGKTWFIFRNNEVPMKMQEPRDMSPQGPQQ